MSSARSTRRVRRRRLALLSVLLCLPALGAWSWPTSNDERIAEGQEAYRKGDFDLAAGAFRLAMGGEGASDRVQYDLGTALLRAAMTRSNDEERGPLLDRAIAALRAAASSNDRELRERTLYNLGNALALRKRYDDAIASYKAVLRSNVEHEDARYNLELVVKARRAGQGDGASAPKDGNKDAQAADDSPASSGEGESSSGTEGESEADKASGSKVEEGRDAANGDATSAMAGGEQEVPSDAEPSLKAQSGYGMGSQQERSMANLTLVQKLEALERRSGELRRRGLLKKSSARVRDAKKGAR